MRLPDDPARQVAAARKYAALQAAVEEAGFFVSSVDILEDHDRVVCTEKFIDGYGYTGIIASVTEVNGDWFLYTPHPYHYRVRDSGKIAEVVIAFVGRRTAAQAMAEGVLETNLLQIDDREFDQAISGAQNRADE